VRHLALLLVLLPLAAAAPAHAIRLGHALDPVAHNPADALRDAPIDPVRYDPATRCKRRVGPGMLAFQAWLERHAAGQSWGIYRCERWGRRSASLHAESRALDWHLDVGVPAQRRAGRALIELLLAPDRLGNPSALARRLGVEEIIWDCSYWGAGSPDFGPYRPCRKKGVDRTTAHRDHIHFGLTKPGASGRTSFWLDAR
jgi:hypothetical protein